MGLQHGPLGAGPSDIIARFGCFPHRNPVLGGARPAELAFYFGADLPVGVGIRPTPSRSGLTPVELLTTVTSIRQLIEGIPAKSQARGGDRRRVVGV
jgi:hypothetical protein